MRIGKKGTSLLVAGALVVATLGGSSTADARGQATATACTKIGTNGTISYGTDGSLGNTHSTQTLTVSCPVNWFPIDLGSGEAGGSFEVVDSSPLAITCTIRAEDQLSSLVNAFSKQSGGNANAYTNVAFGNQVTVLDGGVHIVCTIPPTEPGTGEISFLVSHNII